MALPWTVACAPPFLRAPGCWAGSWTRTGFCGWICRRATGSLTGIGLTLADYCLTFTLCQLEEVERVNITVSGRTISYRYRQELDPSQAVLSGVEETPVEVSAVLYFPRPAAAGWALKAVRSSSRNRIP